MTGTIYRHLEFEDYCALPGENSSLLKAMLVSPLMYHYRKNNQRADTDALRLGRAAHAAVLEPERFATEFVTWEGARRYGKEWDAFKAKHAGNPILTREERSKAERIATSVHAHPVASALLAEKGNAELTITWTHERTGLACKSRIDWLCSHLVDLKTARDVSPTFYGSQAARFGDHLQMSYYATALASVGVEAPAVIIAAQNCDPWDVVVYDVPDEVLLVGEHLYESALDKVLACQRANEWPGHARNEAIPLRLPAWAMTGIGDEDADASADWAVNVSEGD